MSKNLVTEEINLTIATMMIGRRRRPCSLTEGLAESVVGADGALRAFILKLGYFGLIL